MIDHPIYPEAEGQPPVLRRMGLDHDVYWYSPAAVRKLLDLIADIRAFDIENYSLDLPQDIRARIQAVLSGDLAPEG